MSLKFELKAFSQVEFVSGGSGPTDQAGRNIRWALFGQAEASDGSGQKCSGKKALDRVSKPTSLERRTLVSRVRVLAARVKAACQVDSDRGAQISKIG